MGQGWGGMGQGKRMGWEMGWDRTGKWGWTGQGMGCGCSREWGRMGKGQGLGWDVPWDGDSIGMGWQSTSLALCNLRIPQAGKDS